MDKARLRSLIDNKKARLALYFARETVMLSPDGVKSYGMGTRNLQRYDTALKDIQDMIKKLETEIAELETAQAGEKPRRAVGVIPRDW